MVNERFQKGAAMPASIGLCADELRFIRDTRLSMEKEAKVVKARETEIEDYIIENLSKSQDTGVAGKRCRAQITIKEAPNVEDWKAFHTYVAEQNRFDLLQKRISDKAVKEMWEAGEVVPGVGTFKKVGVSLTKL